MQETTWLTNTRSLNPARKTCVQHSYKLLIDILCANLECLEVLLGIVLINLSTMVPVVFVSRKAYQWPR